ncbi:DUF6026 family protein [Dryocola boscaweniae]
MFAWLFIRRDEVRNAKDQRLALVHDCARNNGHRVGLSYS